MQIIKVAIAIVLVFSSLPTGTIADEKEVAGENVLCVSSPIEESESIQDYADAEIRLLAQMVYGEARDVRKKSKHWSSGARFSG